MAKARKHFLFDCQKVNSLNIQNFLISMRKRAIPQLENKK